MKIALCFSGEPRCWEYGYKNIQQFKNIHSDINIDVFIHAWDNITYKSDDYRNTPVSNIAPTICYDSFIKTYNPVLYKIENKNALNHIITSKNLNHLEDYIKYTGFTNISQLYSAGAVHKLRMEYEKKSGVVYDVVLQLRTDLLLNPNNLYISKNSFKCLTSNVVRFHKILIKPTCIKLDHNVWGSSGETMNKIFSTWDINQLCKVKKKKSNTASNIPDQYAYSKSEITIAEHISNCGCIISSPMLKSPVEFLGYNIKLKY